MPRKLNLSPLPEPERRASIEQFLAVLDKSPELAHFRTQLKSGPERQLALFAALERSVLLGSPAFCPPRLDDEADQLLCDILDALDRDPDVCRHGAAYGPDRHLANLQAFGIWKKTTPLTQPSARELFTTTFSHLNTDPAIDSHTLDVINSPPLQVLSPGGDLISPFIASQPPSDCPPTSPQTVDGVLVVSITPSSVTSSESAHSPGLIHHADQNPGEKRAADSLGWAVPTTAANCDQNSSQAAGPPTLSPNQIPARPLRRGRPIKLDDMAKGRLLGLMSYGLSFRQAAAQLGVHHTTLLSALKRDEEFAQQVSEARLDAISQPLLTVIHASRTSWRAAARAPPRSGGRAKFLEDRRVRIYETTPEERELKQA